MHPQMVPPGSPILYLLRAVLLHDRAVRISSTKYSFGFIRPFRFARSDTASLVSDAECPATESKELQSRFPLIADHRSPSG
jgi:hypothetical protein